MDGVQFELEAPARGVRVSVRLRQAGERWVSVATIAGAERLGMGRSPSAALHASLATLKRPVVAELLLDLRLLEASRRLLEVTVA